MLEELLQKEKESLHISLNNVTRKGDIGVALPFICMGAGASRKAQLPSKVVLILYRLGYICGGNLDPAWTGEDKPGSNMILEVNGSAHTEVAPGSSTKGETELER
ncbi:hypothetical protein C5167_026460 [Papaver somniferum]|nr:hypothetical protein C5167_026460 [Papaver somniferum]